MINKQDAQSFYAVAGTRGKQMMDALLKKENARKADLLSQVTASEQNANWQMPSYHPFRVAQGAHNKSDYGTW
jgi:hypothetical protein